MQTIAELLKMVRENELYKNILADKFIEAIYTETVPINIKRIASQFENGDDKTKELIDDIVVSFCGWSLQSLLEQALEIYNDESEDE
jgi:hypothetical protein